MKIVSLIIKIEEDKLNAIKYYMSKKDADLERELGEAVEKIYEKYAPAAVREYIDECGTDSRARPLALKKETTNGIDTEVGTKGVYLSGGEQQRIALARAILKNAAIIVLDEATAFADPDNEYQIQKAFEALTRGKTILMIAHRLSTIQNADQILVIEDGEVKERGTHEELLTRKHIYASMWRDYQKSAQWKVGKEAVNI